MMTIKDLENSTTYKRHHTASRRGYESRKSPGHVEAYNGRFGRGYVVVTPRFDTTRFVNVTYYIVG